MYSRTKQVKKKKKAIGNGKTVEHWQIHVLSKSFGCYVVHDNANQVLPTVSDSQE